MLKIYSISLGVFLAIDGLWLSLITKNFYSKYLGYLMSKNPNFLAAGLFYLIYIFGLAVLVINPAIEKKSLSQAIFTGALFGLCSYATYDLTNLATIKDWPILVTIVDLIWGTILSALISGITFSLVK